MVKFLVFCLNLPFFHANLFRKENQQYNQQLPKLVHFEQLPFLTASFDVWKPLGCSNMQKWEK